ncbi:hypothetical protein [Vallicoccus soli]|uniref:Uncharacterized protein n=1 Tax=Vallicoccus soli TaxID=2339232 RepID=A0A3A3ZDH5_9ACTN|nr:hypothetical protein [Vallicoccus soli]RJK93182.1 hypothetical protein D5H78_17440 [Vallicoccus soli]
MPRGEADRRTAVAAVVLVVVLLGLLSAWVVAGGRAPVPPRDAARGPATELPGPAPGAGGPAAQGPTAEALPGATGAGGDPDPSPAWAGTDVAGLLPVDCGERRVQVREVVEDDLTGDGTPDAVAVARCDAGAGSPPDAVVALAGPAVAPRLLAVLLPPSRGVLVDGVDVGRAADGAATVLVTGTGYSSPTVPRCCPDTTVREAWRWAGTGLRQVPAPPR